MTITLEEFRRTWGEDFQRGYGPVAEAQDGSEGIPGPTVKVFWELDDVVEVVACDPGGLAWDGLPWIALLRLTDGRFVFMVAKCDNYWWDVAEGYSFVGDTLPAVVFFGTTEEDRARLKIANPTSPAG